MRADRRRPPRRERLPAALASLALAAAGALGLSACDGQPDHAGPTTATPPAPGPILVVTSPRSANPRRLTPADVAAARAATRRFLDSYLPVLYGRRPAAHVRGVDAHVAASLGSASPAQRAPGNRHPQVTHLVLRAQSTTEVVAIATIADRVTQPYRIVFSLTDDAQGRWLVSELANY